MCLFGGGFDTMFALPSGTEMTEYLLKQLSEYTRFFPSESEKLQPIMGSIQSDIDILDRKTYPGHITASGIVLSKDCMLMVRHPFLGKWLQPGGHVDCDEMPQQAAMREVEEEAGIPVRLHAWHRWNHFPIDIDIHAIPANEGKSEAAHVHYDFRYILIGSGLLGAGELRAEWINIDDLEDVGLKALIGKIRGLKIGAQML
jgi:8-oxo-dGTP pyrophosphatase MutT (NUDIX family)